MKKGKLLILVCMLMFSLVGCTKTSEDMISKEVNGEYVYYEFIDQSWQNEKYGYNVKNKLICSINGENTSAYLIKDKAEEQLKLVETELHDDGYGIEYTFNSKAGDTYILQVIIQDENKDEIQAYWWLEGDDTKYFMGNLFTKEECEAQILNNMSEVELDNMLTPSFQKDADLDLENIKNKIEEVRNAIYKKTKENRDEIYYVYVPDGDQIKIDSDLKEKYYAFKGIHLDENGDMISMMDYVMLVDKNDFTLSTYRYDENGTGIIEGYQVQTPQNNVNNTDTSNDDTTNNQSEGTSVKSGKYSREEIQAIYDKRITDGGLVHATVFDKTKVINGELCYWMNWGWENASGPVDRIGYIGSDTLTVYQDAEYID